MVFHNGSIYDYHFIMKELEEEFQEEFECLGENAKKRINFSIHIKNGLDNGKPIRYKIKFLDSFRFMSSPLSNHIENLFEGLRSEKC